MGRLLPLCHFKNRKKVLIVICKSLWVKPLELKAYILQESPNFHFRPLNIIRSDWNTILKYVLKAFSPKKNKVATLQKLAICFWFRRSTFFITALKFIWAPWKFTGIISSLPCLQEVYCEVLLKIALHSYIYVLGCFRLVTKLVVVCLHLSELVEVVKEALVTVGRQDKRQLRWLFFFFFMAFVLPNIGAC